MIFIKLAKNQAKAKQHPAAKLIIFESHSLSLSCLLFENNRTYSKNVQKTSMSVLINYMINYSENETKKE